MAPGHSERRLAPDDPQVYMMPTELSGSPEMIEKQGISLKIGAKMEGSERAYHAKLLHNDGHIESCVAVCKRTSRAFETFDVLSACLHQNIAKPIGVWEDKTKETGYIVFQNFDGVLSSVPKEVIFEAENLPQEKPNIQGFSEIGFHILSDLMSAVNYVNEHYQQETTQTENFIPLKSLRIEEGTVFYQLKQDKDYLVLLSEFEIDTAASNQNVKGHKSRRRKAKAGSPGEKPGEEPDVHKICSRNWNNTGNYISHLYEGWTANFEITHLVGKLKEESVKYADLVWEAGLWDLSTKVHFIREIFWCYDEKPDRKGDLVEKDAIGLQNCITMVGMTITRNQGQESETTTIMKETSLYQSLHFLRVFILAHQDKLLEGNIDQEAKALDQRSAERFVLKHKGDYMVRLVEEIRGLKWFKTSPYVLSGHDYMSEFPSIHRKSK